MQHRTLRQGAILPILFILSLLLLPADGNANSLLSDVRVDTTELDLQLNSTITISWQLNEPAKVNLYICNLKGDIVRTLLNKEKLGEGGHTASWNGKDEFNLPVAGGVYLPIIKCSSKRKGTFVYNPSSQIWGEDVPATGLNYDQAGETISFGVAHPTYGRLRVGLKEGGPVYKTIAPWKYYGSGQYDIPWNGRDKENYKSVIGNEKISFSFDAFSLPENSIVVTGGSDSNDTTTRKYKNFPVHPPTSGKISYFSMEPTSQQAEPEIAVKWLKSKKKKDSIILKGKASCRVSFAKPEKRTASLMGGSELILYLDDEYVAEVPVNKLPANIGFDTSQYTNGEHLLTINLLTSDDRMGLYIRNIIIDN